MKKDNQRRAEVRKAPPAMSAKGSEKLAAEALRRPNVPTGPTISSRYIDSRLKQFCWR